MRTPASPSVTDALWSRLTDLVPEALELPENERAAFLDRACRTARGAPDPALRREAEVLLGAAVDADSRGTLLSPVHGATGDVARSEAMRPSVLPERIGPWKLEGLLGEGGMGVVYRAHRADGVFDRRVAVKRLRPGLGPRLAQRLHAESQILASLDHPAIARLYDGGVADDGVPYLVMEHVDGQPITDWADTHELDARDRVRLALAVAEAVAYAHRHLVVHRDLKPSNVFVVNEGTAGPGSDLRGVTPQIKLLDFGLAKLLDAEPTDALLTVPGMMTPAYAAPEQVRGGAITTATDVYALGVILYELLSGQRPYDVQGATPSEAERIVCETEPAPPSSVAIHSGGGLRGDLDGIVLKAMAKDPARRYASAEGFAEDLRRWLDGRPVEAHAPTLGYLARRFVRRHRAAVAGWGGLAIALTAVLAVYTVGLRTERDRARAAEAIAASEETKATAESERAQAIAGFLEQILRAPNGRWYVEGEAKGPDTPIRAVLAEAADRVDRDFADRPALRADLHHIIGDTYLALGEQAEARYHHREVLAIRERLYRPPHPDLAEALYYASTAEPDLYERTRLLQRAAEMLRQRPGGNNLPFILLDLGVDYREAGHPEKAEAVYREARAYTEAHFTPESDGYRYRGAVLGLSANLLVHALLDQGEVEEAGRWVRKVPDPNLSYDEACARGRWHLARREFAEAERWLLQCGNAWTTSSGRSRSDWLLSQSSLAEVYEAWGKRAAAARYAASAAEYAAYRDSMAAAVGPLIERLD